MVVMEFCPKIPLKFKIKDKEIKPFSLIPSSLLAIISAIVLEFAVVRPAIGIETLTIEKASKFTSDTAFPIPWFVEHPANTYWPEHTVIGADGTEVLLAAKPFDCSE